MCVIYLLLLLRFGITCPLKHCPSDWSPRFDLKHFCPAGSDLFQDDYALTQSAQRVIESFPEDEMTEIKYALAYLLYWSELKPNSTHRWRILELCVRLHYSSLSPEGILVFSIPSVGFQTLLLIWCQDVLKLFLWLMIKNLLTYPLFVLFDYWFGNLCVHA